MFVVKREKLRRKALFEVCRNDGFPSVFLRLAVKQGCIYAVGCCGNSDIAVVVGCPRRYVARVFGNQLQIAGLYIQPVGVKDFFVPLVQADDHVGWVILEIIDHFRSDALEWRQVSCATAITPGDIEVIVLVAVIIFYVQEILISLPEEPANIPILDASDLFRLYTQFLLNPNVQPVIDRFQKSDQRTAGRELIASCLRILEKIPQRNYRRNAVLGWR